jgi:hypothetical protein
MKIISFNEIIELNHRLEENGLHFKVHLRDACGRQSMWIEPLGDCACEGKYEELYTELDHYFKENGYKIEYSEDKMNMWLVG